MTSNAESNESAKEMLFFFSKLTSLPLNYNLRMKLTTTNRFGNLSNLSCKNNQRKAATLSYEDKKKRVTAKLLFRQRLAAGMEKTPSTPEALLTSLLGLFCFPDSPSKPLLCFSLCSVFLPPFTSLLLSLEPPAALPSSSGFSFLYEA